MTVERCLIYAYFSIFYFNWPIKWAFFINEKYVPFDSDALSSLTYGKKSTLLIFGQKSYTFET